MRMKSTLSLTAIVLLAMACGNGTGPDGAQVSLSFTTATPAGPLLSAMPVTLTDGVGNTLVITKAEVVLREVELKRADLADCDDVLGADDDCDEFEADPQVLDLPLDGNVETSVTINVEPGTYNQIEFDVHKLDDSDPRDQAILATRPEFDRISMRVEGTYNGNTFVFTSDLNEEQELPISLVIDEGVSSTNVTVRFDVSEWFVDGAGNYVNPESGNKGMANEGMIKENIKNSIEGFEDDDRDGEDDS